MMIIHGRVEVSCLHTVSEIYNIARNSTSLERLTTEDYDHYNNTLLYGTQL